MIHDAPGPAGTLHSSWPQVAPVQSSLSHVRGNNHHIKNGTINNSHGQHGVNIQELNMSLTFGYYNEHPKDTLHVHSHQDSRHRTMLNVHAKPRGSPMSLWAMRQSVESTR